MGTEFDEGDPQQALRAVQASRRWMLEKATGQSWYHWALGAIAGGLVVAQLAPPFARPLLTGLGAAAIALLATVYRRRTGVWTSGLRPGRTRWIALSVGAVAGLGMFVSLWAGRKGIPALGWLAGAIVFAAVTALRYAWYAAYRAQLGRET